MYDYHQRSSLIIITVLSVLVGVLIASSSTHWPVTNAAGDEQPSKRVATEQAEIFRHAAKVIAPSVVNVTAFKRGRIGGGLSFDDFGMPFYVAPKTEGLQPRGLGSGFIFDAEKGYVLTNAHVVAAGTTWVVRMADKKEVKARLIGTDPQTDVAVLQIDAPGLTAAHLGTTKDVEVGDWVLAVGNPFGLLEQTVTAGIISAKGRRGLGLSNYEDFLQTDAAINRGNSGGPLVNLDGEVIGINAAIISGSGGFQGIGFAIPMDQAKIIAEKLIKSGSVVRGWAAVEVKDAPGQGAQVDGVMIHGPAQAAGILPGDIIRKFNGRIVRDSAELRDMVSNLAPGTRVPIELTREGKNTTVELEIGKQPPNWGMRPQTEDENG